MSVAKPLNNDTYHIEHPTGTCSATGEQLQPGDPYIATLVESDHTQPDQQQPQETSADTAETPQKDKSKKDTPKKAQPNTNFPLFRRVDLSITAWDQGHRPNQLFSFWRSIVPEPNRKKKLFVDDEVLLDLLTRLGDSEDPQKAAFRFVLALILMRKKRLKYNGNNKKTDSDGNIQEWWLLTLVPARGQAKSDTQPQGNAEFEVLDPKMDQQQIQEVSEHLGEILEVEL